MFNKERKQRYIEYKIRETSIDPYTLKGLFERTQKFENELEKDVCDFTTLEIANMYKTMSYTSADSLFVTNSLLVGYCEWALKEGFVKDSQIHFLELKRGRLNEFVNVAVQEIRVVSRETVIGWCQQVLNASDAFILLGLFEGIKGKNYCEFTNLKGADIDFTNKTAVLCGRDKPFQMSAELCQYAQYSLEESVHYGGDRKHNMTLTDSDLVIKEYPNCKQETSAYVKSRRITNRVLRAFDYLGVGNYMTPRAIVTSGMIHMARTERKRLNMEPRDYVYSHVNDISSKFGTNIPPSVFMRRYGDFLG